MTSSAVTSSKRERAPELALKPVFGEGREGRWKAVQEMFKDRVNPLYADVVSSLEKDGSLKCRLLQSDDAAKGVIVYSTKLSTIHGKESAMEIPAFYTADLDSQEGPKELSSYLLNEALQQARELKASSVCLKVSKKAVSAFRFFEENQFTIIKNRDGYTWICRTLEVRKTAQNGLRERIMPPVNQSTSEPKKAKLDQVPEKMDECPIKRQYFDLIRRGKKTIEGRIATRPFTDWQVGTYVKFKNGDQRVTCQVTKVVKYDSFADMLTTEGFKPCLPDVQTLEKAIQIYRDIPGYADKERHHRVLAIHIKVVE